jgi:hypothetical protein
VVIVAKTSMPDYGLPMSGLSSHSGIVRKSMGSAHQSGRLQFGRRGVPGLWRSSVGSQPGRLSLCRRIYWPGRGRISWRCRIWT